MQGKGVGDFRGMVRFCEGWVWNERLLTEVSEKRKGYGKCDNPSGSRPNFFGRQHLTFDKGRAWMPEVERPEFRKDAKPTERSYGKCGSAFLGIALLGFAIRINAPVNIDEGKNQRD